MFEAHKLAPRAAALFATQQRWLISHAALAHYFEPYDRIEPGVSRKRLGLMGPLFGIASRNTAYALFDEAVKYDVLHVSQDVGANDERIAVPSSSALLLVGLWYQQHLEALDVLDGGQRQAEFIDQGARLLAIMQPHVARGLLSSPNLRAPGRVYTVFTWSDSGGWLMDRLVAGMDWTEGQEQQRFVTDVCSITSLAEAVKLSRAHTSRKLSEAQAIGGLGWTGRAGRSPIWISRGFYEEYAEFQARKLLIIDQAYAASVTAKAKPSEPGAGRVDDPSGCQAD
jgi:hypothetical protein